MTEPRRCSRCKTLRTDFTGERTRCDRCRAEAGTNYAAVKADPVRYAARLAYKREARAKAAAHEASRWVPVTADGFDVGLDVAEDQDWDAAARLARDEERARRINEAVDLYRAGLSTTEIAKRFGLSAGKGFELVKAAGIVLRSRSAATSAAMVKWHGAHRGGLSKEDIAMFDEVSDE